MTFLMGNISKVWVCGSRRSLSPSSSAPQSRTDSEETCAERETDSALWRQDRSSLGRRDRKCHFALVRASSVCEEQQVVDAQKRHLKRHGINFARDAARVGSASRLWERHETATEITFTRQCFFLSLTADKEDRLASGGFRERRRTDRARVCVEYQQDFRARTFAWMDGNDLATFYECEKSFWKPLEGRMDAKSERYFSLTRSAIVMETS